MEAHMHRDRRLPTRVNTACDRCRQRKQRCDDERPCVNCASVDIACTSLLSQSARRPKISARANRRSGLKVPAIAGDVSELQRPVQEANIGLEFSVENADGSIRHDTTERHNEHRDWRTSIVPQASPTATATSPETRLASISEFDEGSSAVSITRQIFNFEKSRSYQGRDTSAIPGSDLPEVKIGSREHHLRVPISDVLGVELPPKQVCDSLLDTYFQRVHWFSLVVYEPTFRARYINIVESGDAHISDRGFLLLLAMILIMGSWYRPEEEFLDNSRYNLTTMRNKFLHLIRSRFMDLMDEDSLEFVQLCSLLGSFYLYHSRPRSSFSMLGAAIKTAQAMRLHRLDDGRSSSENMEERKRIWWTLYTWDRFATIIYGRPLGINDRDCSVSMPSIFDEDINFEPDLGPSRVCLSAYQTHLNKIYQIASPLLENLYRTRQPQDTRRRIEFVSMIAEVDESLQKWQNELPTFLAYDRIDDIITSSSAEVKAHRLQALSLQLTYDNLVMVVNRPLLADESFGEQRKRAFQRCLQSALSTSMVQSKKNLVALARQTHLVSFLGINLFTASVVLFICACSDILSNVAQEAKRGMARTLQLQKALSMQTSLSMQCSVILEDLIQLVLEKEKEAMLLSDSEKRKTSVTNQYKGGNGDTEVPSNILNAANSLQTFGADLDGVIDPAWGTEFYDSVENAHFRESLMSFQRVVQDNVFESSGASNTIISPSFQTLSNTTDPGTWQYTGSLAQGNNEAGGGRLEDLGQFWLWNLSR